jgi:hypothetical protein
MDGSQINLEANLERIKKIQNQRRAKIALPQTFWGKSKFKVIIS